MVELTWYRAGLEHHVVVGNGFAKYNPNDKGTLPYSERRGIARAWGRALANLAQALADEDAKAELMTLARIGGAVTDCAQAMAKALNIVKEA